MNEVLFCADFASSSDDAEARVCAKVLDRFWNVLTSP